MKRKRECISNINVQHQKQSLLLAEHGETCVICESEQFRFPFRRMMKVKKVHQTEINMKHWFLCFPFNQKSCKLRLKGDCCWSMRKCLLLFFLVFFLLLSSSVWNNHFPAKFYFLGTFDWSNRYCFRLVRCRCKEFVIVFLWKKNQQKKIDTITTTANIFSLAVRLTARWSVHFMNSARTKKLSVSVYHWFSFNNIANMLISVCVVW